MEINRRLVGAVKTSYGGVIWAWKMDGSHETAAGRRVVGVMVQESSRNCAGGVEGSNGWRRDAIWVVRRRQGVVGAVFRR